MINNADARLRPDVTGGVGALVQYPHDDDLGFGQSIVDDMVFDLPGSATDKQVVLWTTGVGKVDEGLQRPVEGRVVPIRLFRSPKFSS